MVFGNSVSGRTTEITSAVLRKDGTRAETPFSYHTQTAEYKPYGASQDSKHWLTTSGFGAPSPQQPKPDRRNTNAGAIHVPLRTECCL
jgi:hypothetical protein